MYLVDTSVLTRLRMPGVAATVLALDDVRYSPISGLEFRFSASDAAEWDLLSVCSMGSLVSRCSTASSSVLMPYGGFSPIVGSKDENRRI